MTDLSRKLRESDFGRFYMLYENKGHELKSIFSASDCRGCSDCKRHRSQEEQSKLFCEKMGPLYH